jgi:hypothetical protein
MADPHVISALERLYARHSGSLRKAEADATQLRSDMIHIEAVLRIYRAEWNAESVKPIATRRVSRWIYHGEGVRSVLDVLRMATGPLTTHDIAKAVFQLKGMPEPDAITLRAASGPIHKLLRNRDGVIAHPGKLKRWSLVR